MKNQHHRRCEFFKKAHHMTSVDHLISSLIISQNNNFTFILWQMTNIVECLKICKMYSVSKVTEVSYIYFFLILNNKQQEAKRLSPDGQKLLSCWSVCVVLSDPTGVDLCSFNAAWPQVVLKWPATNNSDWIKTSLGLISIPDSKAHNSGHPGPCQKPAVVTCPLIIHPKHKNNASFLSGVGQSKGRLSFLSRVKTSS